MFEKVIRCNNCGHTESVHRLGLECIACRDKAPGSFEMVPCGCLEMVMPETVR